jgi:hypothetical protein
MKMDVAYQYDGVFKDQAEIDANTINYKAIVNTLRPGYGIQGLQWRWQNHAG